MATYLPNISDTIQPPQLFQPNWQFFEGALQTLNAKQQAAIDSLSSAYYVIKEAPLTHDDNKKLRENFLKSYENDIKNLASLDLTKTENLNYASSMFNPLIDNKSFLHDYIFTKETQRELQYADESSPTYNEVSKKALQYSLLEYSKLDYENRIRLSPQRYIPYIDSSKLALDYLQKIKPEVSSVTKTEDGDFLVTTSNGEQSIIPFTNIALTAIHSDPRIKESYKQEAYVNRMQLLYNTNNPEEGYKLYIEHLNKMQAINKQQLQIVNSRISQMKQQQEQITDQLVTVLDKALTQKEAGVTVDKHILTTANELNEQKKILENNIDLLTKELSTVQEHKNILDKANLLKSNYYDDIYAQQKMMADALISGEEYAMATMKRDVKANPFAVENLKFKHELALENTKHLNTLDELQIKYKMIYGNYVGNVYGNGYNDEIDRYINNNKSKGFSNPNGNSLISILNKDTKLDDETKKVYASVIKNKIGDSNLLPIITSSTELLNNPTVIDKSPIANYNPIPENTKSAIQNNYIPIAIVGDKIRVLEVRTNKNAVNVLNSSGDENTTTFSQSGNKTSYFYKDVDAKDYIDMLKQYNYF